MRDNEKYWLQLYKDGKIEIDFNNGIVYSYLRYRGNDGIKKKIGGEKKNIYLRATAGPSKSERYHILLHRLIWICAYGEIPDDLEINHKNGIKGDNRLCNLEMVTKSENEIHKRRVLGKKGGVLRGEDSLKSKLTKKQVDEIRFLFNKKNVSRIELSHRYNVTPSNISQILLNQSWFDENYYPDPNKYRSNIKLDMDKVNKIRKLKRETNKTNDELGELFNVAGVTISRIINNRGWKI